MKKYFHILISTINYTITLKLLNNHKYMKKRFFIKTLLFLSLFLFSDCTKANYRLVIGTYRQGPGGRPEVSGITSPSLHSIPIADLASCEKAGNKIFNEIYKPVWQFDNRWTCIYVGNSK